MENKPLQEQAEQTQIQDANEQKNAFLQESNTMDRQDAQQSIEKQENSTCKMTMTEAVNGQHTPLLATAVTELNVKCYRNLETGLINLVFYFCSIVAFLLIFMSIMSIFLLPQKSFSWPLFLGGMVLIVLAIYVRCIMRERLKYFQQGIIERYEFYKDYFLQRTLKNGVFVGEMRYSYQFIVNKKFVPIKGDSGYLILDIYCRYTRFYVHLKGVSTADLQQLQQLFAISLEK